MALTIFSTLNDRGLPLGDEDIFKSYLYKKATEQKCADKFIDDWNQLYDLCEGCQISIADIFRYHMHIIRAKNNSTTNLIALRKFYTDRKHENLNEKNIMQKLHQISTFWSYFYNDFADKIYEDSFGALNDETKKYLQILRVYPNEWWGNIVSVLFYFRQKEFEKELQKIVAILYLSFIEKPTVTTIKPIAFKININISNDKDILSGISVPENFDGIFSNGISSKIIRGVLLLYLYINKKQNYISDAQKYHIEHIFPKKWQDTNYKGWNREDANLYLENIGNLVLFEDKLNIQAGNEYFKAKQIYYKNSNNWEVRNAISKKNEWLKDDIIERETKIENELIKFFKESLKQNRKN